MKAKILICHFSICHFSTFLNCWKCISVHGSTFKSCKSRFFVSILSPPPLHPKMFSKVYVSNFYWFLVAKYNFLKLEIFREIIKSMTSFRVSKAIKQPQRLVRLASTGSLKDKTIGVIGMGHVGKFFLVLPGYTQYRFIRNGL